MTRSLPLSALPADVRARLGLSKRGKRSAQSLKVQSDKEKEAQNRRRFLMLCESHGLPAPVTEYRFAQPDRQFAFDFAWPDSRVALESVGGIWVRGAHSRGKHQLSDMTKFNLAAVRSWRVLQVPPPKLCTSETIALVRLALRPVPL